MNTDNTPIPSEIGAYKVEKKIASGGMGEIYLVYDSFCDRHVALKKIRSDRLQYPTLKDRFLREAKIASQMAHPSIIPIYSLHIDTSEIYYTMPFIEGQTLKQILRQCAEEEKQCSRSLVPGRSIQCLMRIFLNICQAIAYCHSRGVLHRDIKPENVIVGKFGETFILDWGLADFIHAPLPEAKENFPKVEFIDLTRPGKIPGTLSYIPPERILGKPSTFSTDIYALGVILYQLLTLKLPFHRTTDKKLKKQIEKEKLIDPIERAPYRDIPLELSHIAKKCLCPNPLDRYASVDELIAKIENFIEGRGEWTSSIPLDCSNKNDWEFQENILMAKHVALTRAKDIMEWVTIMISKTGFLGKFKIETTLTLGHTSQGLGFLLNVAEKEERKGLLENSFCLWIGSQKNPGCTLFRGYVQILSAPEISLTPGKTYNIKMEREETHLKLFIDDKLVLDYLNHIPLSDPHFGIMLKDGDLEIKPLQVFVSSPTIMVNCLKIPDTFLSNKNFSKAFIEYRKISQAFPGRTEGREALFRAGITLVEEAADTSSRSRKNILLLQALEEFGKLRNTPGAPLEYLGKSLVYKASEEVEEEIKCLELCLRKYVHHPLKYLIDEEVIFRLHQAAYQDRKTAYHFALIALRHLPHIFSDPQHNILLKNLKNYSTPLDFIEDSSSLTYEENHCQIAIQLAFLLCKPTTLVEILETSQNPLLKGNALFCLIKLGCIEFAEENLHFIKDDSLRINAISIILQHEKKQILLNDAIDTLSKTSDFSSQRALSYLIEESLLGRKNLPRLLAIKKDAYISTALLPQYIAFLLVQNKIKDAISLNETCKNIPIQWKTFFDGCILSQTKGSKQAIEYFQDHPCFYLFQSLYIENEGQLSSSYKNLFFWEKHELLYLLLLFAYSSKDEEKVKLWSSLLKKEKQHVKKLYNQA